MNNPAFSQDFDWIATATFGNYIQIKGMDIDSSENIYYMGYYSNDAIFNAADKSVSVYQKGPQYDHYHFFVKYSPQGKPLWVNKVKYLFNAESPSLNSMAVDKKGNCYITGSLQKSGAFFTSVKKADLLIKNNSFNPPAYVAKYSTNGELLWYKPLPQYFDGAKILADGEGNTYVFCHYNDAMVITGGIVCLDSLGNIKYDLKLNGIQLKSINVSRKGEIFMTGKTWGRYEIPDIRLGDSLFKNVPQDAYYLIGINQEGIPRIILAQPPAGKLYGIDIGFFINSISFDKNDEPVLAVIEPFRDVSKNLSMMKLMGNEFRRLHDDELVIAQLDIKGNILWYKQVNGSYYNYGLYIEPDGNWILQTPIERSFKIGNDSVKPSVYTEWTHEIMFASLDIQSRNWRWAVKGGGSGEDYSTAFIKSNGKGRYYIVSKISQYAKLNNEMYSYKTVYLASFHKGTDSLVNPKPIVNDSFEKILQTTNHDRWELDSVNTDLTGQMEAYSQKVKHDSNNYRVCEAHEYIFDPVGNSISQDSFLFDYNLFPNPTDGKLTANFNSLLETVIEIRITDLTGRMVDHKNYMVKVGNNTIELDLKDLADGYYAISLFHHGKVYTEKILKSK